MLHPKSLFLAAGLLALASPGLTKDKPAKLSKGPNISAARDYARDAEAKAKDDLPASKTERAAMKNADPLTQAAFWMREFNKNPTDREAATQLSELMRINGQLERAIDVATQGLSLRPDDKPLLLTLGRALAAYGDGPRAIEVLQRLSKMSPKDPAPLIALGVAYDQSRQPELALATYEKALKLRPDDPAIRTNIGLSHALSGNLPAAESVLRSVVEGANPPQAAKANLALVIALQGRFAEADTLARQTMSPEDATATIAYAKSLIAADRSWSGLRPAKG